jgi:hypothetical protein
MLQFFITEDVMGSAEEIILAESAEDAANRWAEQQQNEGVQGTTATIYVAWELDKPRKLKGKEKREMGVDEIEHECQVFDVEFPEFPVPVVTLAEEEELEK